MAVRHVMLALALFAVPVHAQPSDTPPGPPDSLPEEPPPQLQTPSEALRAGNAAATAGDWAAVSRFVDPLLSDQLPPPDLAEAHRLAGLAAFFQGRRDQAEQHFLAYLRIDLDGQLDPALYPGEAVIYFNDVKAKHNAELRARRPKGKRFWVKNLLPPLGQLQNGERTKGIVVGGLLGSFLAANITTYVMLRRWCSETDRTCDDPADRVQGAQTARSINIATGIGTILTFAYGVVDGALVYSKRTRERTMQPFMTTTREGGFLGVAGSF